MPNVGYRTTLFMATSMKNMIKMERGRERGKNYVHVALSKFLYVEVESKK